MNSIMVVNETHDYDKFHRLVGNRQVKEVRVKKIIKSIQTVGAIPNPIIVNEKMEVIDGQGRLEALRRLSLKVYYIVIPGLGLPECRNMNIDQTNWTLQYKPRMTCYGCDYFIASDKLCNKNKIFREAVDLLKAQEPKPPRFAVTFDKIFYACDKCGKSLLVVANAEGIKGLSNMPKYCPECGQAVKWE